MQIPLVNQFKRRVPSPAWPYRYKNSSKTELIFMKFKTEEI